MEETNLEQMAAAISRLEYCRPVGRVTCLTGSVARVAGLPADTGLGDRVRLGAPDVSVMGEIIRLEGSSVDVLLEGAADGAFIGAIVERLPRHFFAPHESWIGRVLDPDGRPLDGRPLLPGAVEYPLQGRVLPANLRRAMGERIETGIAAFNTLLPLARGQRLGLFAGSGVGKSTLLANLAKGVSADVVVISLSGERGREVREFTQNVLGPEGMQRAVVVAATSDRAPNVRRRCAWAATSIAEYFRDNGKHVLLLCDSITRFCEAHREVAVSAGDASNLRGFPATTNSLVATLCERAGPGTEAVGDITAIYTVLVAGSDMDEPIADMMRGILDGHIVLDRAIAERGRFPAIDVLKSVSRSLPGVANTVENELIARARRRLASYSASETMIRAGLYEAGSDPELDAAVACHDALDQFLSLRDGRNARSHFASLRQTLEVGTPLQS